MVLAFIITHRWNKIYTCCKCFLKSYVMCTENSRGVCFVHQKCYRGLSLKEALVAVKRCRDIRPNDGFLRFPYFLLVISDRYFSLMSFIKFSWPQSWRQLLLYESHLERRWWRGPYQEALAKRQEKQRWFEDSKETALLSNKLKVSDQKLLSYCWQKADKEFIQWAMCYIFIHLFSHCSRWKELDCQQTIFFNFAK